MKNTHCKIITFPFVVKKLHGVCVSLSSLNVMMIKSWVRWVGHVTCMGELKNAYKSLVWKPEVMRLLGRHSLRQEDSIKMNLRETGWEVVDWIHLAQDQPWSPVNMVVNHLVP